jgi:hypothetical protein
MMLIHLSPCIVVSSKKHYREIKIVKPSFLQITKPLNANILDIQMCMLQVATRPYFIIKKNLLVYIKKENRKKKPIKTFHPSKMTKPSVCVQTAVGKEPVFGGVYGVLGLRPMGLPNSPALCHYPRVLLPPQKWR